MSTPAGPGADPGYSSLRSTRNRSPWPVVAFVGLLALASLALILWVNHQWSVGYRLAVAAMDNLAESRVQAVEAGALAERVLGGDPAVQPSDVSAALDAALVSLANCRSGYSQLAGIPGTPPANKALVAALAGLEHALDELRAATRARLAAPGPRDGPGTLRHRKAQQDLKYAVDTVNLRLAQRLAWRLNRQHQLLTVLVSLWAAFALGLTALVWNSVRERNAARHEVRRGLELLRTIVECAQVAILLTDVDGKIRVWNGFAERLFGWKRDEVYGKTPPFVPPGGEARSDALAERVLQGEVLSGIEVSPRNKSGTPVECVLYAAPLRDGAGAIKGVVGVFADVSAQKRQDSLIRESEARYRQVVENSPLGIYIQLEGLFHYLNPAAVRLFGAQSGGELIGTRVIERVHPDYHAQAATRMRILAEDDQPVNEMEQVWLRANGEQMFAKVSAVPFHLGDRRGALAFFTDVSDVRLAQEEKRKVEERLFQAQKMESIGRLAGGVAHDFNNLLTVINGYGELLGSDFGPADPRREYVGEILRAGQKGTGLTRQLLAFSRKQIIEPTPMLLNDVVRESEKMFRRLIGEDIELVTDLAGELWPVMADPGQMHQVLLNLVVNARDAMPSGGRVVVATRNLELDASRVDRYSDVQPGAYVELSVSDTGVGMSGEVLEHLFEPFFTTKERGSGTGLGLPTVYGIVRQAGGSVAVDSTPGRGSRFTVLLPRCAVEGKTAAAATAVSPPAGAHETILIAEDNAEVRGLAGNILKRCGYRILAAPNAEAALQLAEKHPDPIHLLLTDVVMPGVSGKELADLLADLHPETRCLYMSGYTADVIGRRGVLEAGTELLPKPFTPASLQAKVRMVLDRPRSAAGGESD